MTTMAAPITSLADLRGRRALVLGLARSGIAAARALADAGAKVTAYDRRDRHALADGIGRLGGRPVALALAASPDEVRDLLRGADLVVTSPSISPDFPTTDRWLRDALRDAAASGVQLTSEVDLFLRLTRARVLAVTGTKGKTTTTALIGAMMEAGDVPHLVGGNIGAPLIERLDELSADHWAVLELSELQLPTISRGADLAVYTNITADHLDRHASLDAYRNVKGRLARLTAGRGAVVLNADDPGCAELGASVAGELHWYGLDDPSREASVADGELIVAGDRILPEAQVPLAGRHMLSNVLAGSLAARLAGISAPAIAEAIRGFPGVPHRLEELGTRRGVRYVNDSQATIPMATLAALDAFRDAPVVLIAGGQGKGLDYRALADAIVVTCRAAVLIGETAAEMESLIAGRLEVTRADSVEAAVMAASGLARAGDVVLLSPPAASFDMFNDYAARGDAFRAAVEAVAGGEGDA
jgi:UDP-N-acetylmuramoylalanine--D-glutamate ligase